MYQDAEGEGEDSINSNKIASLEDQVNRYFAKTSSLDGQGEFGVADWSASGRYQDFYEKYGKSNY